MEIHFKQLMNFFALIIYKLYLNLILNAYPKALINLNGEFILTFLDNWDIN